MMNGKTKTAKKCFSLLLSLLMVLACLPVFSSAQETKIQNGDTIQFGNYPQDLVTDSKLVQELEKAPKEWKSYNYCYYEYEGSGTSEDPFIPIIGEPSDAMQYADFSYNGKNYRGVNFVRSGFLTGAVHLPDVDIYPHQDKRNQVYYFEYTPIQWLVVDAEQGIVISKNTLDQQNYRNSYVESDENYYTDSTLKKYANDYSESQLRTWLNHDFLTTAFTDRQSAVIAANEYDLDEYFFIGDCFMPLDESVCDKITVPTCGEFFDYNILSTVATDYANVQGSNGESLATRTVYDIIVDNGCHYLAITDRDNADGAQAMPSVKTVTGINPMMKLTSLQNNTETDLFETDAAKCSCFFHKTQHSNNTVVNFFVDLIKSIFVTFSINQYCDCGLKHY